jgi:hypothetical protein
MNKKTKRRGEITWRVGEFCAEAWRALLDSNMAFIGGEGGITGLTIRIIDPRGEITPSAIDDTGEPAPATDPCTIPLTFGPRRDAPG